MPPCVLGGGVRSGAGRAPAGHLAVASGRPGSRCLDAGPRGTLEENLLGPVLVGRGGESGGRARVPSPGCFWDRGRLPGLFESPGPAALQQGGAQRALESAFYTEAPSGAGVGRGPRRVAFGPN